MYKMLFQLCLLSWISLSLADPSKLRGYVNQSNIYKKLEPEDKPTVLCRVATFGTMYVDANTVSYTEEAVFCLPIVNNAELELELPITLPKEVKKGHEHEIEMGTLLVSVSDAMIFQQKLVLGFETEYTVIRDKSSYAHLLHRHLQIKPVMSVAVIRVSTSDSTPTPSRDELQSVLFSPSGINFVNQYNAISFGKLQFNLAPAGVVEIQVPSPVSSFATSIDLVIAAQEQIKSIYQIDEVAVLADKVLMCLPPGTGNWAASAGVNHWRAQFNDQWCTSLSGTMHELGHTMGLLHARADGVEYADRTGYMGSGYPSSTFPVKAFNGYNSWTFGWYSDRHFTHSPQNDGDKVLQIASIVDYNLAAADEYVVVSINDQFFLQFNEQKGFNIDTEQKQNQITVTEGLTDGTDSRAGLDPEGSAFTVANFNGSGQTLTIEACRRSIGSNGASIMAVSISLGQSLCTTPSPTPAPVTAAPVTAAPTNAPVTPAPVTAAPITANPTAAPISASPVAAPLASVLAPPVETDQSRSAFLQWLDKVLARIRDEEN